MNQTELQFRAAAGGQTQNQKLQNYLLARPGQWLPMPELAEAINAYAVHSRIADLRKLGMTILHKNKRLPSGALASTYCYLPNGEAA